jgi:hypothetical protein
VTAADIDAANESPARIKMEATAVVAVRTKPGVDPLDGVTITGAVAKKRVTNTNVVEELEDAIGYDVLVDVTVRVDDTGDVDRRAKDKIADKLQVLVTDDDGVEYAEHHNTTVGGRA